MKNQFFRPFLGKHKDRVAETAGIDADLEGYLDREEATHQAQSRIQRMAIVRVWRRIRSERLAVAGGLALILVATGATIFEPWVFGRAIDRALLPKDMDAIRVWAFFYFGIILLRVSATILQALVFENLGQRVVKQLRVELYQRLQSLSMEVYDRNPSGRLITRVTNDIQSLGDMFSAGFVSMILNLLTIAGILVWMTISAPRLAVYVLAVMPFLFLSVGYFSEKLRYCYRTARSRLSALNAFLAENILGMRVVQLFGRERLHLERFDRLNSWYIDAQKNTVRVFSLFVPTITFAQGLATTLVLYFGAGEAMRGEMAPGMLVAYFTYIGNLFQPMRDLADKWNIFLSGMASAERIFGLLDWKPEEGPVQTFTDPVAAEPYPELRGEIVFENVWFAYEGEKWVLRDFKLTVRAGERIGVVGHTGAGKSTLISLLLRFREPQRGRVLLDGRDIREYDRRRLRASIGMVQQDVFLFSGSIEENVHLWRHNPGTAQDLQERLVRLGLDFKQEDFSRELEERGGNLSAGQRQILAFERARTMNPRLWILDEATSNIDSETEHRVVSEFDGASRGKTCFLIAHRLATVRECDRVLVLHRGELVECGSHVELISRDGLYARLYRFQTSSEELETTLSAALPDAAGAHTSPAT